MMHYWFEEIGSYQSDSSLDSPNTKKVGTEPTFLFKTSECLFNLNTLSLHIGMVRRANKWTTRRVGEAKFKCDFF